MKNLKSIANTLVNISIIIAIIIGTMAFIATPKMTQTDIKKSTQSIEQIEKSTIKTSDPTTWEVVWVSSDFSEAWMSISGDIHVFPIIKAYDDIIVITDFNGDLQEYYYTVK